MAKSQSYNRAEVIEAGFFENVKAGRFPQARVQVGLSEASVSKAQLVDFFESQVISRCLDLRARELKNKNLCYYTIGSSGHEGNAVLGGAFRLTDMAFLHYRSGAFMVQRAKALPGATPVYDNLLSFEASSDDPISGGRHKVFGSRPLLVPPQTSTIASHLPKAVGAALSIGRARDLGTEAEMPPDALVVCSFGDASANHAAAQAAFNTAAWIAYQNMPVPLVFVCEDNGLGISVNTPTGWIENSFRRRDEIRYFQADGLHLLDMARAADEVQHYVRHHRKPAFLHMKTVRLMAHAGSDPEWIYRGFDKIEATEFQDPLLHSARILYENSILSLDQIVDLYAGVRARVNAVSDYAVTRPKLRDPAAVRTTVTANTRKRQAPPVPTEAERAVIFGRDYEKLASTPAHMAKLINYGLHDILLRYGNTLIFGEDVAQKGGVYNVTDGLYKKFSARRVFNSLLDETSILGNAIGFAQNGFVPIPEIQFLAYVHNAEDQIRGEAATLAFFSKGQFTNPMVIRIPGLAYQKGFGGHFHNDNSLAIFRDIPGVILAVPSNGADAVRMMRTAVRLAHEDGRVVVFVEPIALYMTKDLHHEGDRGWSFPYPIDPADEAPLGEFGHFGDGEDVLILTYGNGVYYSRQALEVLKEKNIHGRILDLRWLAPLNWDGLFANAREAKRILIVDECRKTGSLSEGLVAGLLERFQQQGLAMPRTDVLAADDCFIPLGYAAAAGLPKRDEIVAAVENMMGKG